MRTWLTRILATVGAATMLVVGFDYVTYAATGQSLLLGRSNSANRTTSVTNTGSGPALSLVTRSSATAPFATNAKGKVVNLNADRVDGLTATQILTASQTTTATVFTDSAAKRTGNVSYQLGALPAGSYLVTLDAAVNLTTAGDLGNTPATVNFLRCWLHHTGSGSSIPMAEGTDYSLNGTPLAAASFSTVLSLTGTETLVLECYSWTGDGWTSYSGKPVSIAFVRLDVASDVALP